MDKKISVVPQRSKAGYKSLALLQKLKITSKKKPMAITTAINMNTNGLLNILLSIVSWCKLGFMCRNLSKARSAVSPEVIGNVAPSMIKDKLPNAGWFLCSKAAGIPTKLEIRSSTLMKNISRFDVLTMACFVARKAEIRRAFIITEITEYAARTVNAYGLFNIYCVCVFAVLDVFVSFVTCREEMFNSILLQSC